MGGTEFVSEAIEPLPGGFGAAAMVRGEPGLPPGFRWRGEERKIAAVLETGQRTRDSVGERYVHRHGFRLRMDDDAEWDVYFLRQPPYGWFLRSVRRG